MLAAFRLLWGLTEQVLAGRKRAKELVVQVITIREDHQGWVGHRWVLDDLSCVESHRQTLATSLCMPNDTDTPVALGRSSVERAFDSFVYGMELVITADFFLSFLATGVENGEVADQVEEPLLLEDAAKQHFHLQGTLRGNLVALNRAPGHESLPTRSERAYACFDAVRNHKQFV